MRLILVALTLAFIGCAHPYSRIDQGPNSEWFIVVPTELSLAEHERFADELPIFASQYATAGDVIHILAGDGVVSFIVRVPGDSVRAGEEVGDTPHQVARYFLAGTHIDGHNSCHLDLGNLRWRMKQLRETNYRSPVIILGSERPHRYLDFGCECRHRPHSLLKEFFAGRFHPEYQVETRKKIEFEEHYGIGAY